MTPRRRQHNLTVLADGSVLATGGQSTNGGGGLVDLANAVYAAERWDPATGAWTDAGLRGGRAPVPLHRAAAARRPRAHRRRRDLRRLPAGRLPAPRPRDLHPALPLPQGRQRRRSRRARRSRGARRDRLRRRVRAHLAAGGAASASSALVRLGAPTHSEDQGQRYVPLAFTAAGTTLTATGAEQPERGARRPLHALRGRRRGRALRRARSCRCRAPSSPRAGPGQPRARAAGHRQHAVRGDEGPEKALNGSVAGRASDKCCAHGRRPLPARRPRLEPQTVAPSWSSNAGAGGEPRALNTRDFRIETSTATGDWSTAGDRDRQHREHRPRARWRRASPATCSSS